MLMLLFIYKYPTNCNVDNKRVSVQKMGSSSSGISFLNWIMLHVGHHFNWKWTGDRRRFSEWKSMKICSIYYLWISNSMKSITLHIYLCIYSSTRETGSWGANNDTSQHRYYYGRLSAENLNPVDLRRWSAECSLIKFRFMQNNSSHSS